MSSEWYTRAACRNVDPDSFFPIGDPEGANFDDWQAAKAFCLTRCPVADDCLDYAIAHSLKHGVFGGTDPDQRDRIRRNRARKARVAS